MKYSRFLITSALVSSLGLFTGCFDDDDNGTEPPVDDTPGCVDEDNNLALSITEDCELAADSTYHLQGLTFVDSATLTIGAGATIKGLPDGEEAALVINPGAKIMAIGTAAKPIVFTAGTSAPERGDLAGVVLLGKADLNLATETGKIEGLTDVLYGGTADDDNSGELKYVRIEYAGHLIGADNELNGLTMGGVGSGTKISYVQVYEGLDDCFEWFGGAVSADHLVATGCDDDIFDWDLGWRGSLQFALGVHGTATSADPNGIEADNLNGNEGNTPRSNPKVANLTLIGNGATSQYGMHLRRGTAGHIVNSIVTGFKNGTVRISGNTSINLAKDGDLKAEGHLRLWQPATTINLTPAASLADSVATLAATRTTVGDWFLADSASLELSATSWKPSSAPSGAVAVPAGLAAADYLGAFDPAAATLWTAGWIRGY